MKSKNGTTDKCYKKRMEKKFTLHLDQSNNFMLP